MQYAFLGFFMGQLRDEMLSETLLSLLALAMLVPVSVFFVEVLMALPAYRPRGMPGGPPRDQVWAFLSGSKMTTGVALGGIHVELRHRAALSCAPRSVRTR